MVYTDAIQLEKDGSRVYLKSRKFDIELLKESNFIVAGTVMIKASKFVPFDVDLNYGEDWMWYHKLYKSGCKFKYIPIPTIYYRNYTSVINVRRQENWMDWNQKKEEIKDRIKELYK